MNKVISSRSRKFRILSELFILNLILYSSAAFASADNTSDSKFKFGYNVEINNIPRSNKNVTVFIPVPQSFDCQKIENLAISPPYPYEIIRDAEYGNLAARITVEDPDTNQINLDMTFTVDRKSITALDGRYRKDEPLSEKMRKRYLSPDHLVPLDGPVLEACETVVNNNDTDLDKARDIYDYVVSTMTYDKSGIGWGRGDVIYACKARHGNCTDFHSLFIGMARAAGIPARFIIGFPIGESDGQGQVGGYHCWAEFYTEELGWIPVDASEASKHPDKKEYYFGNLDPHRVAFTMGRDIVFDDNELAESLNYFIYPVVFINAEKHDDIKMEFEYSRNLQ